MFGKRGNDGGSDGFSISRGLSGSVEKTIAEAAPPPEMQTPVPGDDMPVGVPVLQSAGVGLAATAATAAQPVPLAPEPVQRHKPVFMAEEMVLAKPPEVREKSEEYFDVKNHSIFRAD